MECKTTAALRSLATSVPATAKPASPSLHDLGSVGRMYEDDRIDKVAEPERRAFTYLMLSSLRFVYASAARFAVVKFVASMGASAEALALAFAEFDISAMEVGETLSVKWRGKPIYIRRRSPEEAAIEAAVPMEHLRDQETDEERTLRPDFIVVVAICPHLGCIPVPNEGDYGGWFCPCHGSHYDVSGRIRKGPSPLNLEVPPYKFMDEKTILMG
jgi:ubiquinol-cytochrome c reductase iron-sulfur subunit